MIIMGNSLKHAPFNKILNDPYIECPKLALNLHKSSLNPSFQDVLTSPERLLLAGDCDTNILAICKEAGLLKDLNAYDWEGKKEVHTSYKLIRELTTEDVPVWKNAEKNYGDVHA